MEKAVALEPKLVILRSNFATLSYPVGEVERPLRVLAQLNDEEVTTLKDSHAYGT